MALDTRDRRCDLLFLFSILSVGCSDDGVPATSDQGSTSGPAGSTSGDATLTTSASTSATSSAPTTGEATSTDTDGSGANTDGSSGSSSNDGSGSSSGGTSEGTTMGSTEGTMGTTEGTMGSTESSSSGGEPTLCELSGAFYADCFGGGDPEVEEMAIAYCEEAIAAYFDISDECGMLQETLFLCITTLECIEVGMVGNGGECDDAYDAAVEACM
jgi:hypothetical protein